MDKPANKTTSKYYELYLIELDSLDLKVGWILPGAWALETAHYLAQIW